MWSPERVREVAATLLEADAVEAAVESTRPGWRLLEGVDDAHPVVRIGGPASLAEREIEWLRDPMRDGDSPDPWSLSHVLGEPTSIQDDVRLDAASLHADPELQDVTAWHVLVALNSGPVLRIHDAGAYWVLVPRVDLATGRWDRAIFTSSSG